MTYKIIDIEGIGDVYAEKLIAAGINTDKEMLEKCCKPAGRKALAEADTLYKPTGKPQEPVTAADKKQLIMLNKALAKRNAEIAKIENKKTVSFVRRSLYCQTILMTN